MHACMLPAIAGMPEAQAGRISHRYVSPRRSVIVYVTLRSPVLLDATAVLPGSLDVCRDVRLLELICHGVCSLYSRSLAQN